MLTFRLNWRCPISLLWGLLLLCPPVLGSDYVDEEYLGPSAIVASPDGEMLYIACADDKCLAWLDATTEQVVRWLDMPASPTGLALTPDGRTLAVSCADSQSTIAIVDCESGELARSFPAGHTAMSPVFSPDGKRLYVCNRFDNNVSVLDASTGQITARIQCEREPIAAALCRDGRRLLVANHLPNTRSDMDFPGPLAPVLTVIDTTTFEIQRIELPVGSHSLRDITTSPDGTRAYVTHLLSNFDRPPSQVEMGWTSLNVVSVIDLDKLAFIETVGLDQLYMGAGNPWGVRCTPDGRWVCVCHAGTDELTLLDRSVAKEQLSRPFLSPLVAGLPDGLWGDSPIRRRIQLLGHGPRALTIVKSKIYVAEYFTDSLTVIDLQAEDDGPPRAIALGPKPVWTERRRGEYLFNCATICYQHWQSCSSCHPDGRTDSLNWDLLNDGIGTFKNTKSLLLAHRTPPSMFEAVRETAEEAVRAGITHILFQTRPESDAEALDAYLRSLQPVPSPRLIDGKLSKRAQRGRELFESKEGGCYHCHPAPLFTDRRMHDVGTQTRYEPNSRFDTPTLIEVWRTAPYLHDGRYTTLRELLVEGRHGLAGTRFERLSDQQISDLVEYVLSL